MARQHVFRTSSEDHTTNPQSTALTSPNSSFIQPPFSLHPLPSLHHLISFNGLFTWQLKSEWLLKWDLPSVRCDWLGCARPETPCFLCHTFKHSSAPIHTHTHTHAMFWWSLIEDLHVKTLGILNCQLRVLKPGSAHVNTNAHSQGNTVFLSFSRGADNTRARIISNFNYP